MFWEKLVKISRQSAESTAEIDHNILLRCQNTGICLVCETVENEIIQLDQWSQQISLDQSHSKHHWKILPRTSNLRKIHSKWEIYLCSNTRSLITRSNLLRRFIRKWCFLVVSLVATLTVVHGTSNVIKKTVKIFFCLTFGNLWLIGNLAPIATINNLVCYHYRPDIFPFAQCGIAKSFSLNCFNAMRKFEWIFLQWLHCVRREIAENLAGTYKIHADSSAIKRWIAIFSSAHVLIKVVMVVVMCGFVKREINTSLISFTSATSPVRLNRIWVHENNLATVSDDLLPSRVNIQLTMMIVENPSGKCLVMIARKSLSHSTSTMQIWGGLVASVQSQYLNCYWFKSLIRLSQCSAFERFEHCFRTAYRSETNVNRLFEGHSRSRFLVETSLKSLFVSSIAG